MVATPTDCFLLLLKKALWSQCVKTAWKIDPAVAVHLPERFKNAFLQAEVVKHIRNSPKDVLDISEALRFLIGSQLALPVRKALKVTSCRESLTWGLNFVPVSPHLGSCATCIGDSVFRAPLRQRPCHPSIRSPSSWPSSGRPHFLFCSPGGSSAEK